VYGTPIALEQVPGHAWALQAPPWEAIRFKFAPRLIALSKPDIYDPHKSVAHYITENRFTPALQLHGFTVFLREGDAIPVPLP
ncbi:MAG: hypothetical protein ACKOJB_14465, partial [Chthoniobacterales bacterium]